MDNEKIFELNYEIKSVDINTNRKLGLYRLLGILQDVTYEHAFKLDFGYENLKSIGFFWVLIRQKLKMEKWPKWHDKITIKTWTLPAKGFFVIREYEIFSDNIKIGECSTTWVILDSKSRKPKEMTMIENSFLARTDYHLNFKASKILVPKKMELQKSIEVNNSDLDMNNHVNNVKYSQWMLDAIPFEKHKEYSINEYEINFLNETFLGDKILCYSDINIIPKEKPNETYFYGQNEISSKNAFTIKIKTTKAE
ncbi:MAG: acyl-[acyl-carrier-protein] thioesterase [Bacteroidetes bacterium]|nr:acyl-[acyl-carrier-protein] thioesterase [Bacteroidota bacterium]